MVDFGAKRCYHNSMNIVKATESDGIELLYRNKSLYGIPFYDADSFNRVCDSLELDKLATDIEYSQQFNIPQHYVEIDVESYIRTLVADAGPAAQARVEQELEMFRTRNLYPILQLLIYIVDTMRKNNIVWGVGRGSSVASYCLYLLGVHKIDSLKYNLDIREFLK